MTIAGPAESRVGNPMESSRSPAGVTAATRRFVPPRSTPMQYVFIQIAIPSYVSVLRHFVRGSARTGTPSDESNIMDPSPVYPFPLPFLIQAAGSWANNHPKSINRTDQRRRYACYAQRAPFGAVD